MPKKILVVDDERKIVRLVRDYLEQSGFAVLAAENGQQALHVFRVEKPNLVIFDLGMPEMDGLEVTRVIRRESQVPIIMLTARLEETDKLIGLELGADDYITKPFSPKELVARVRAVLRRCEGTAGEPEPLIVAGDVTIDISRRGVTVGGSAIELTPTEFELLSLFMENPGHTYTREELLEKTLGYSYEGTGRTLDSHIRNLRHKVEPHPAEPIYIQTVHRIGYRFTKDSRDRK